METSLLKLAIFLLACFLVKSDDTNAGLKEPSACRYSTRCYNPFWCEAVLSTRECSNRSRCCADLYNKVKCLQDLLDEGLKKLNSSSEVVDNLTKNVSGIKSQHAILQKEVDALEEMYNDNEKATSSEIQTLKNDVSSVKTRLETLNQKALDVEGKHSSYEAGIEKLEQHNFKTDDTLKTLTAGIHSTSDQLYSLKSITEEHRNELQAQLSNITDTFDKNISNNEKKWRDLFRKETETVNQTLHSLDLRWSDDVSNLNTSVETLNGTIQNVKVKSTEDLKEMSTELKDNIRTIETKTESIEKNFETFKHTIGDDIEKKANSAYDRSLATINEKADKLGAKITELKTNMDSRTSGINTELIQLTKSLTQAKEDLESKIKVDTETLRTEVNRNIDGLDRKLKEMSANSKNDIDDTNKQVSQMRNEIEEYKLESARNLENEKKSLTDLIQRKISEVQIEAHDSLEKVLKDMKKLEDQIGQRIKSEVEQLSKQTTEVNQTLNEQKEKVDIILPNTFNKEMFIIAFLVLVVLLAINYGIVYILVKRTSPSQPVARRERTYSGTSTANFSEEPHSPVEIYNRLTFPKSLPTELSTPLKDSVGVVSFYEDSQKHHKRLLKSIEERLTERLRHDVTFEYQVVRRHEHIPEIPHSKLCIMFVEFSERHVIIEEPGLGLGDLKRKTAAFINRMGACLMIVYVKDPGSRHLKSSELFNGSIHCAKSQPELLALSKLGRFLSIYDKFTDNQTERLVDVITANLGHSGNKHNLRLNLESLK